MSCKSCGTGGCGTVKSTNNPTNESENKPSAYSCSSEGSCGCNKLNSYDWLMDMDIPTEKKFPYVEIKFRNGRKEFALNAQNIEIITGQWVVMDMPQTGGYDIGTVSLQGELVRLQMMKKKVKAEFILSKILRIATEKDLEKASTIQSRNMSALFRVRQIIRELELNMKMSDVEYQADGSRILFYYSSEDRVDFRELIKILALEFRARIEMKQISNRQEAARIGGIGVCGRELCCATWLTDFKNVINSAARYQNISINSNKLAGQCGRLKCCLNYELDTYMEALKDIPKVEALRTQKGIAKLYKTDIFRKIMWFGFNEEGWIAVSVARVEEILAMNDQNIEPANLLENEIETKQNASSNILARIERQEKRQKRDIFKDKVENSLRKEKRDNARTERARQPRPKMRNNEGENEKRTNEKPLNTKTPNEKRQQHKTPNERKFNDQKPNERKTNENTEKTNKFNDEYLTKQQKNRIPFDHPLPNFEDLDFNESKILQSEKNQVNTNQQKPTDKKSNEKFQHDKNYPKENPQKQQNFQQRKPEQQKLSEQHPKEQPKKHTPPKSFNLPKLPDFTELPPEKKQNQKNKQQHDQNKNQQNQNQQNHKRPPRQNL